ncbi:hypothetical protein CC78DRAFT_290380 [Lojkania enalia]|uniref:Uncharacterized protein n=1 Tax=Lojkania enalia TaxID=147567 RepID=A0A9P4N588_9PLEO|nr:hypothetical protein CC78DRAFT_290380 [Didymosphaeria enalia]
MQRPFFKYLSTVLLVISFALANPLDDAAYMRAGRAAEAAPTNQIQKIYPRQDPTAFTTERSANTEFAPPRTVTPPDPSATGTQTTTHEANTEIIPSPNTGSSAPPVVPTTSRSANTEAIQPTPSSTALAMPTGVVRMDAILGAVAMGIAGIV